MSGRKKIFTDEKEINEQNIIKVLSKAMLIHSENRSRMNFLLNYESGTQPLLRNKTVRSDIDIQAIDNVASEITEFKTGFDWGNVITLIQRGVKDSGDSSKQSKESIAISLLNECFYAENINKVQQEVARYTEITGLGYTYLDLKDDREDGESLFTYCALDPRNAFLVYSNYYIDERPLMGVTYSTNRDTGDTFFTCFTKENRFEIVNLTTIVNGKKKTDWKHLKRSGEKNPFNIIPITEWERRPDRTGCFERQINLMDSLNIMESDFVNDVDQNTQAIWHANDVEFAVDENGEEIAPKSNDWLMTFTSKDGKTPFVKPLSNDYDYGGVLQNIVQTRQTILQNAYVPVRGNSSSGATGVATSDSTGWSSAEMAACKSQAMQERAKMNEVKIALKIIEKANIEKEKHFKPLLKLKAMDCQPNVKRQKTYELTVKSNFIATMISHGINGLHAIKTANVFEDANQVWEDSKQSIEQYQASIYNKADNSANNNGMEFKAVGGLNENKPDKGKLQGDESDQIDNSSNIDGLERNQKLKVKENEDRQAEHNQN